MSTKEKANPTTEPAKRMVAQRCVATIPVRSADSTWDAVTSLALETLQLRGYPRIEEVEKAFDDLRSLTSYFLTRHALEGSVIEFDMEDLWLVYSLIYGRTEVEEDLALPPIEILGPLSPETILTLTFYLTFSIEEPFVTDLVQRINDEGVVIVKIESMDPDPFADEECPETDSQEPSTQIQSTQQSHSEEETNDVSNH